ncbi:MAG: ATP-dependent 6-phosphofructokinase [Polyangiaceae bacterium]|nr:ATP-dependent 6-phosphofructokinase [Polyangiaceae bacterium]MCE7894096.1 ATP-dependent 6-phosphofructokinase [Sorangiineae bacterium PRO1]MCL4754263.1 ATP-dependent 6-phosphofructokinase [Myxococcales bacterium]
MIRRIAVNTGGGDAPGLNAVIRAVAISGMSRGWEVLGIRHGYRGLLDEPDGVVSLDRNSVRGIHHLGGTILGSTNRGDPFHYPVLQNGELVPTDVSGRVIQRLDELGVDALVAIGGDGSIKLAAKLLERGLRRVIAVPKTIDNDLSGTDLTFGFDTAVATATEAIDKLHTTAQAHERVMTVEVMGRNAGWIALYSGIAGGADVILIPEIPFDIERVCDKIRWREAMNRRFAIVVVAEGAMPVGGEALFKEQADEFKEHGQLGGIAERVAREIQARTGKETRSIVLGHLQRGGSPVMTDRVLSLRLGCAATRFIAETNVSGLVALRGSDIRLVPLAEGTQRIRTVPPDSDVLVTGRQLGVCFGDEPPESFEPSMLPPPPSLPAYRMLKRTS